MKRNICICVILLFALFALEMYGISVRDDLTANLVRLHIIANSNSAADQEIKLGVRDEVIKNVRENKTADLPQIEAEANRYLESIHAGYRARVMYGKFDFPVKSYNNITLPSGRYKAVRVVLGEGAGRNWWCVLSPPMCFTDSAVGEADTEQLEKKLDSQTVSVIKARRGKVNIKFKIVELLSGK